MKSKQSVFEEIISQSIRRARQKNQAGSRDQFELRMKGLPTKIKELDADPYMFIFDALIQYKDCVDYVLNQYLTMIEQNFLSASRNAEMLVRHFRVHAQQHSFKIIQFIIKIKQPHLLLLQFFFELHSSIAMPENVLESFRYTGYKWLARAFSFKKLDKPPYVEQITSGILKSENRNLPTAEDQQKSLTKYIQKVVINMVLKVESDLSNQNSEKKSKYGHCFMCCKPADYYCKDTKIPVCGSECKKAHINYISNNPSIDFQYTDSFRKGIEELLISNIRRKKNLSLSIDYLCAILTNSNYTPQFHLPHSALLNSPVIAERIWLLYIMHYGRRGEVFQHIFADCLAVEPEFVALTCSSYFLKMSDTRRLFQFSQSLDGRGFRRILPIVLNRLAADEKVRFIYNIINQIYNANSQGHRSESSKNSSLLRVLNHEKNPLKVFREQFGEERAEQKIVAFIIKNQQEVNRSKACDLILSDDRICRAFLKQLLILEQAEGKNKMKGSPLIDEILRQIFYFINVKVSDKIYRLLEILCQVLSFNHLEIQSSDCLPLIFSKETTSSPDCFFQFAYFIIMVTTELNQKDEEKKVSEEDFIKRVGQFDKKFADCQREYIAGVYSRLVSYPFSQKSRGILTYYPSVPKVYNPSEFEVRSILLDNWEAFYEQIMGVNNETAVLYKFCSVLVGYPTLCQSFLQLLLNKLDSENQFEEEHLVPSISSIIQEEPNCVGSSWRLLFKRSRQSGKFLFDLSALVHYSKSLTTPNFIWFCRYYCQSIQLGQSWKECLKLLSYNFDLKQNPERIQILNKQMVQLYSNEFNAYYQIEFLKGVFTIGDIGLASVLLSLTPVNVVTECLLITALNQIVSQNWKKIEEWQKSTSPKRKQSGKEREISPIWMHIINKVCTIGLSNRTLLQSFSNTLLKIEKCEIYFEELNIMYSISLPEDASVQIHEGLVQKLDKFKQHLPQMNKNLLREFINQKNLKTIVQNFKYFWKIGEVYTLLRDHVLNSPSQIPLDNLNDVLAHANYIKEFENPQSETQPLLGFVTAAVASLQVQPDHIYAKILEKTLNGVIMQHLNDQSVLTFDKLICIGKCCHSYLESLHLSMKKFPLRQHQKALKEHLFKLRQAISSFNKNHQLRLKLYDKLSGDIKCSAPPGLLIHQRLANSCCLQISFQSFMKILRQILEENKAGFDQLRKMISKKVSSKSKLGSEASDSKPNWELDLLHQSVGHFQAGLDQICDWLEGLTVEERQKYDMGNKDKVMDALFEYMHKGLDLYVIKEKGLSINRQQGPIFRLYQLLKQPIIHS